MPEYLQIDGPDAWTYQVPLDEAVPLHVGRLPQCNIALSDPSVSARHALIFRDGPRWKVQDNKSRNGTFVNGVKVGEAILKDKDLVKIGQTELTFRSIPDDDAESSRELMISYLRKQETAIRGALDRVGPGQAVAIPTPLPIVAPTAAPATPPPDKQPHPEPYTPPGATGLRGDDDDFDLTVLPPSRDDMNWIAGQVAEILADLATLRGWSKRTLFDRLLQRLRASIGADNGFLMIAEGGEGRWVIRAWVGDASAWTSYEKQHPVPITVANQAFNEDRVISNALGNDDDAEEAPRSESMLMLNVHCYIAVPLHFKGVKEGLLYFDTRRSFKTFGARDIKLLDRIGAYILQIEHQN